MTIDAELARQTPQVIADPDTGEEVLRSDTAKVADLYARMKVYAEQWKDAQAWCRDALLEAADAAHVWTWREGRLKVTADPPSAAAIVWDLDELHKLEALLPPERYGELVKQVVTETPQTVKLQALARQAGPDSDVARIINQAQQRKPKNRYVKVSVA